MRPWLTRWSQSDLATLKRMASGGFTAAEIAHKLKRTASAVYTRVQFEGIALKRGANRIKAQQAARRTR
jgi:hypothetical protein